jgi:hypothetical protein
MAKSNLIMKIDGTDDWPMSNFFIYFTSTLKLKQLLRKIKGFLRYNGPLIKIYGDVHLWYDITSIIVWYTLFNEMTYSL